MALDLRYSGNRLCRAWLERVLVDLERAGVLCGLRKIDGRDWYAEGAAWLVSTQDADGSWKAGGGAVHRTCFALLFLRRGTVPVLTED